MFCSFMSVFLYFSGFEPFAPLERWCDFAKFWCGKKKLVAVIGRTYKNIEAKASQIIA